MIYNLISLCGPQGRMRIKPDWEANAASRSATLAGEVHPVSVPNPEVKPPRAEGTATSGRGRLGRRRPVDGVFSFNSHLVSIEDAKHPFSFID